MSDLLILLPVFVWSCCEELNLLFSWFNALISAHFHFYMFFFLRMGFSCFKIKHFFNCDFGKKIVGIGFFLFMCEPVIKCADEMQTGTPQSHYQFFNCFTETRSVVAFVQDAKEVKTHNIFSIYQTTMELLSRSYRSHQN